MLLEASSPSPPLVSLTVFTRHNHNACNQQWDTRNWCRFWFSGRASTGSCRSGWNPGSAGQQWQERGGINMCVDIIKKALCCCQNYRVGSAFVFFLSHMGQKGEFKMLFIQSTAVVLPQWTCGSIAFLCILLRTDFSSLTAFSTCLLTAFCWS